MMSEHTKEPWKLLLWDDESFSIHTDNDDPVVHFSSDDLYEDARRIVACVNACAGISTSLLERATPFDTALFFKAQSDELLLLLKEHLSDNPEGSNGYCHCDLCERTREAIAKVEKEMVEV